MHTITCTKEINKTSSGEMENENAIILLGLLKSIGS